MSDTRGGGHETVYPIAIVCDHHFTEQAAALRAVLETFRLRVDLYRMVQYRHVAAFFAAPPTPYAYTIICTHGMGETVEDMQLRFDVVDQRDDAYDRPDGWHDRPYLLTPAVLQDFGTRATGSLISLACGSGREPLAQAFLQYGYRTYMAPESLYYDVDGGVLFCVTLFYFLLAEEHDYASTTYTERAAFDRAQHSDPNFLYGTRAFRRYTHADNLGETGGSP